jgi:penicillin amidase
MLEHRMLENTFEDELGWQLFTEYGWVGNVPTRRLRELLDTPEHALFDDVRTNPRESLPWIAIRSFVEAVRELRQRYNSDVPSEWTWGHMHDLTLRHVFAQNPVMRPTMDRGPYPIGGSSTTISKMEWRTWAPFSTAVYPSMRIISDLRDSIQYSVVPGGISGQPLDAHYSDQVELYLRGGYVRVPVRAKPDVSFSLYTTLVPR